MNNVLDLRESIRTLVEGRIKCENCGNDNWEEFLYVGNLPNGGLAGCKRCAHPTPLDQIVKDHWQPSKTDLAWTRALISVWNEGATWITSFAVFKANVKDQILALIEVKRPDIIDRELAKVRTTFEALGWQIVDQTEGEKTDVKT